MIFTLKDMAIKIIKKAFKDEESAQYIPLSASNQREFVKNNEEKQDNGNESGRNS